MEKQDVFISYRRDGGEFTAKMLRDRLTELGYRVFFDLETLRSGNFNTKLYEAIDQCDDFLLVLSPGALDRCASPEDWVRREVEYALMKGKNVVPILLRGFTFPEELPESLQALPYCNGLEANSQFFDAFLEKLQQFLRSEPPVSRRIIQNSVFKKMLPFLLAIVIFAGLALGAAAVMDAWNGRYPRTAAEQNLTREAIYYTGANLTCYDILADAKADALAAARRYLQTGELTELNDAMERSLHTLRTVDLTSAAPSEAFQTMLLESPFDLAEFTAMHDSLLQFRESCLEDVAYIRLLVTPEFVLSGSQKLETVGYYEDYLDNELRVYAYAVNQMLLPITDPGAMELFFSDILTELERIPLNAASWSDDYDALAAVMDECTNNMENALHNLESILGKSNLEAAQEQEMLIRAYEAQGYTRQQAEKMVELVLLGYTEEQPQYIVVMGELGYTREQALAIHDYVQQGFTVDRARVLVDYESLDPETERIRLEEHYLSLGADPQRAKDAAAQELELRELQHTFRLQCCGKSTDGTSTLWYKMLRLRNAMLYPEAVECLDLYALLVEDTDPHAYEYLSSVISHMLQIGDTGIDYGVLVMGYADAPHEVLRIGDIIIAVNGQPCRTVEAYVSMKGALPETEYTVTVLRPNNEGLEWLELQLTKEMPLISVISLAIE